MLSAESPTVTEQAASTAVQLQPPIAGMRLSSVLVKAGMHPRKGKGTVCQSIILCVACIRYLESDLKSEFVAKRLEESPPFQFVACTSAKHSQT